jgi:hypothetical protein
MELHGYHKAVRVETGVDETGADETGAGEEVETTGIESRGVDTDVKGDDKSEEEVLRN